jgi:hypothetical protein
LRSTDASCSLPPAQSFSKTRARLPTSQRHIRASKELTDRTGAGETVQDRTLDTVPSSHGPTRGAYRAVRHRCQWTFCPGQRTERRRSAESTVRNDRWVQSCRRGTEQCYTGRVSLFLRVERLRGVGVRSRNPQLAVRIGSGICGRRSEEASLGKSDNSFELIGRLCHDNTRPISSLGRAGKTTTTYHPASVSIRVADCPGQVRWIPQRIYPSGQARQMPD